MAVSLLKGDITKLTVDVIVNAANRSLLGGGGVDGAIHSAAGPDLLKECRTLGGCETGDCKMTDAYKLPARRIAHTAGPIYSRTDRAESERLLRSCYTRCLEETTKEGWKSIAFCSISTGIYGYPIEDATHVALGAVKAFLAGPQGKMLEKVVFCVFSDKDKAVYEKVWPTYFL